MPAHSIPLIRGLVCGSDPGEELHLVRQAALVARGHGRGVGEGAQGAQRALHGARRRGPSKLRDARGAHVDVRFGHRKTVAVPFGFLPLKQQTHRALLKLINRLGPKQGLHKERNATSYDCCFFSQKDNWGKTCEQFAIPLHHLYSQIPASLKRVYKRCKTSM